MSNPTEQETSDARSSVAEVRKALRTMVTEAKSPGHGHNDYSGPEESTGLLLKGVPDVINTAIVALEDIFAEISDSNYLLKKLDPADRAKFIAQYNKVKSVVKSATKELDTIKTALYTLTDSLPDDEAE